jgi:hypothetical protein
MTKMMVFLLISFAKSEFEALRREIGRDALDVYIYHAPGILA